MTATQAPLLLVGLLLLILVAVWLVVRAEDRADEAAERTARQFPRLRPPEGAVKPAEPTYRVER